MADTKETARFLTRYQQWRKGEIEEFYPDSHAGPNPKEISAAIDVAIAALEATPPADAALADALEAASNRCHGQDVAALRKAAAALRARQQAVAAFVPYTDAELREWFPVMCNHCGWRGLSRDCTGGGPIADTGDFNEITCPQCWADGDGKAVDPREVVVVDGRRPIADVADIRTAVGFIFGRFCRPEDASEVPDDVVAAVRRLESAVGPDTIVQRAKRHALYRAENQSVTREGFVLVPAKPTSDQLLAGVKTMFRSHGTQNGVVGEVYRAMLAASQSATGGA